MSPRSVPPPRFSSSEADSEEFFYHLYRGSELLSDGRYDGARDELERALRMQPTDLAAQDLLAKLYFKLGFYPRAIEIYLELTRQHPERIAPRINLALSYIKTGQMRDAVLHLLPVIEREPEHARAWGYLGLAWSRLNEFAKAREAFVRAGHQGMARRMEESLEAQYGRVAPTPSLAPASAQPRQSVLPPADRTLEEIESDAVASEPIPMDRPVVSIAEPVGRQGPSLHPPAELLELHDEMLMARRGACVRYTDEVVTVGVILGPPCMRVGDGEGVFAGHGEIVRIAQGWCLIPVASGASRTLVALQHERLSVRECSVVGFDDALTYQNGALGVGDEDLQWVEFQGQGSVVIESPRTLRAVHLSRDEPLSAPASVLIATRGDISLVYTPARRGREERARVEAHGVGMVYLALETSSPSVGTRTV